MSLEEYRSLHYNFDYTNCQHLSLLNTYLKKVDEETVEWIKLQSEHNDHLAINNIGYFYMCGINEFNINFETAIKYYRKASDLGNPLSMYNIGYCLSCDNTITNLIQCLEWYHKSANLGFAPGVKSINPTYRLLTHLYIKNGDLEGVIDTINKSKCDHYCNYDIDLTKLCLCAAKYSKWHIVDYLYQSGIDIDKVCIISIEEQELDLIIYSLKQGWINSIDKCYSLLVGYGELETAKLFLDYGANINCLLSGELSLLTGDNRNIAYEMFSLLLERGMDSGIISDQVFFDAGGYSLKLSKILCNYTNNHGINQVLSGAVIAGKLDIVKFAVENGANINSCRSIIVMQTSDKIINYDVFIYLLDNGLTFDFTSCSHKVLLIAIHSNKLNNVKHIISTIGIVPVNEPGLLETAIECKNMDIIQYLVEQGFRVTSHVLICAVKFFSSLKLVQYLLNFLDGEIPEKALKYAFLYDNRSIIKCLMDKGVHRISPLSICRAVKSGYLDCVKFVCENSHSNLSMIHVNIICEIIFGCDQYYSDENLNILKYLCQSGRLDILCLGQYTIDRYMSYVVNSCQIEIFKYLVDSGIHISQKSLEYAKIYGDSYFREYIQKYWSTSASLLTSTESSTPTPGRTTSSREWVSSV